MIRPVLQYCSVVWHHSLYLGWGCFLEAIQRRALIHYGFCRAMLCISAAYAVMRCLSVCLSVCVRLSRSWILSKRINVCSISSLSGSHAILVFPHQTSWRYSDGDPLNGGAECRRGRQKSRFWAYVWLHCSAFNAATGYRRYQHGAAEPRSRKLWHLWLVVSG